MIYLIRSAAYTEERKFFSIIKVGYTEDSNRDKRFNSYLTHNPTYQILHVIPNATQLHETALHFKFKDLQFKNEWFEDKEEIVDYIKSVTLEELDNLSFPEKSDKMKRYDFIRITKDLLPEDLQQLAKDHILFHNITLKEELRRFYYAQKLWEKDIDYKSFGIEELSEQKELLSNYYCLGDNVSKRIKYICEYVEPDLRKSFLDQLTNDDYAKSYILQLGENRCRALSYNVSKIRKELGIIMFDSDDLRQEIYRNFKVGDRKSKSDIKTILSNIYNAVNYKKTAKAIDIDLWFETKSILLTISGKRINGFELLKKK